MSPSFLDTFFTLYVDSTPNIPQEVGKKRKREECSNNKNNK